MLSPPIQPAALAFSFLLHAGVLTGVLLIAGDEPPVPLAVVDVELVPAAPVSGEEPDGAVHARAEALTHDRAARTRSAVQPVTGTPRAASLEAAGDASSARATVPANAPVEATGPSASREERLVPRPDDTVANRSGMPALARERRERVDREGDDVRRTPADETVRTDPARADSRRAGEGKEPSVPSAASPADATGPQVAVLGRAAAAPGRAIADAGPRVTAASFANERPRYPERARRQGLEGRVVLHVRVSAEGVGERVEVAKSSGHGILDQAALVAVRKWRFVPARRGGLPVASAIDIPIRFRLEGG